MKTSDEINELSTALNEFQSTLDGAPATAENPYFGSRYSDLASIWDTIRDPLTAAGLSIIQGFDDANGLTMVCRILHTSGQWIESRMPVHLPKSDPQAVGSAVSYYRRYHLASLLQIVQLDDDGERAQAAAKAGAEQREKAELMRSIADLGFPAEYLKAELSEFLQRNFKSAIDLSVDELQRSFEHLQTLKREKGSSDGDTNN